MNFTLVGKLFRSNKIVGYRLLDKATGFTFNISVSDASLYIVDNAVVTKGVITDVLTIVVWSIFLL